MGDLQELFSRLKAQASDSAPAQSPGSTSIWAQPQEQLYQQPSVSSPLFSPPAHTPNPIHSSRIISPVNPSSAVGTPAPDHNRTNNLLNLLKFNNQGTQSGPMANLQNVGGTRNSSLDPSASDSRSVSQQRLTSSPEFLASFHRQPSSQSTQAAIMTGPGAEKLETVSSSSANSKDFLLNLLKRPNAASAKTQESIKDEAAVDKLAHGFAEASLTSNVPTQQPRESIHTTHSNSMDTTEPPLEPPPQSKPHKFSYMNPFDQLHSSSPLNRSPRPEAQAEPKKFEILKHNRDVSSNLISESAGPATKSRKLTVEEPLPRESDIQQESEKSQSVSEALEGVAETVDKQVEQALAEADTQEKAAIQATPAATGDNAIDDTFNTPQRKAATDQDVDSSWESAASEEAERSQASDVEIYNFPMKPFVSIQVKSRDSPRPIRQENFLSIAQLKKGFDQMDRCLVTASQTHIVYAQVATKKDNGGFRIIRQDTADHKQVFRSSGERIFGVQLCNSPAAGDDVETVLGTGVNGSIFWTSLAKSRGELFADDDVEAQGLIMPPVVTEAEHSSGSPVKTRAKLSSRHPEYFGVARGNQIHIVAPEVARKKAYHDGETQKINAEKYLAEHGLRITTGKASKDFCFSEDDTMIVSLDKSGRFKFWDIKDLTSRARDTSEGRHDPIELRDPIWELAATASDSKPDEKPSVSSIMFLDKERPTLKGIALRYMLIGFKQNHILQLWDLGLGKAVQELRLPHEKDSDGICSITYHPRTGIIAVAHPTRNSIYFIHLSAPKYINSHMDQAKYVNMLARQDPSLPRPESTAIMSGLREFSFDKIGQIRSVDMLRHPLDSASDPDSQDATLFELYVMHSKGVVDICIQRKDLGWDKESKMVKPIDALQAGVIEVRDLSSSPVKPQAPSEQSSTADPSVKQIVKPATVKKQETSKSSSTAQKAEALKKEAGPPPAFAINGATQASQSKAEQPSKQVPEAPTRSQQTSTNPPLMTAESYSLAAQRAKSPTRERAVQDSANTVKKVTSSPTSTASAPLVSSIDDLQVSLTKQFDSLYSRIESDKRVQDASGAAKQDAVLRLVSSTLTENVEKSLNRIVSQNIMEQIAPVVTVSLTKAVEQKVSEILTKQLDTHVGKEIKNALPHAVQQALKDAHVHNSLRDSVAQKVQQQVSHLLQQSMPNMVTQATQKAIADLEARNNKQQKEVENMWQQDQARIQELAALVQGLSEMMQNMSESQTTFQDQMLKMQRSSSKAGATESSREIESQVSALEDPEKKAEDAEVESIHKQLLNGEYDSAIISVSIETTNPGAVHMY